MLANYNSILFDERLIPSKRRSKNKKEVTSRGWPPRRKGHTRAGWPHVSSSADWKKPSRRPLNCVTDLFRSRRRRKLPSRQLKPSKRTERPLTGPSRGLTRSKCSSPWPNVSSQSGRGGILLIRPISCQGSG
jgi:hypothetical protein